MKKLFVEPEIKKIELDLSEKIASSSGNKHVIANFVDSGCVIYNTRIPVGTVVDEKEIATCIVLLPTRIGGTVAIPLKDMREYIR